MNLTLLLILVVFVVVTICNTVSIIAFSQQQNNNKYNSRPIYGSCRTGNFITKRTTTTTTTTTTYNKMGRSHEPIASSYKQLHGTRNNNDNYNDYNSNRRHQTSVVAGSALLRRSTIHPYLVPLSLPLHNIFCTVEPSLLSSTTTPTQLRMSSSNDNVDVNTNKLDDNNNTNNNQELNWERINKQLKLFVEMSIPYFKESSGAKWLLGGVLVLTIANSGISVLFSYVGKDFWNALSEKNVNEFYNVLGKYIIALGIGAPVTTLYRYQREQLTIHWREWMTSRTFTLYTQNQVYYKIERNSAGSSTSTNIVGGDNFVNSDNNDSSTATAVVVVNIDNPDQRITEDVKTFTSFSLQLMITLLTSIIDLVSFSLILWSIYPTLFFAVIAYAATGTVITALIGKPLVSLNFLQLKREADLRYLLVRIRDNAESIAFYSGEDIEGTAVTNRIIDVMDNKRSINSASRNLEFFTNSYRYFIQILPVAVVAPQYFAGTIALGVISQSAGAFNHILSDLSILINQFEQLSAFSAGIERLSDFYTAMKYADPQRSSIDTPLLTPYSPPTTATSSHVSVNNNGKLGSVYDNDNNDDDDKTVATTVSIEAPEVSTYGNTTDTYFIPLSETATSTSMYGKNGKFDTDHFGQINLHRWAPKFETVTTATTNNNNNDNNVLVLKSMDLCTPDKKRVLIRDLSMTLPIGQNLLIVGNSGAGKSSLLRAIAGLWTIGNGQIERPADEDVYFLPQRPYCTIGTIKDQLLYPSFENYDYISNTNSNITSATGNKIDTSNTNINIQQSSTIMKKSHMLKQSLSDDDLLEVLKQVDLYDIAIRSGDGDPYKGLYSKQDWSNILSLGEQQRLAFGRLLVNRPSLVILDEATSALDIANEAKMYILLRNMAQKTLKGGSTTGGLSEAGLTYISVGHRPSLINFHDMKLRLAGDGTNHEMTTIDTSGSSSSSISSTLQNFQETQFANL